VSAPRSALGLAADELKQPGWGSSRQRRTSAHERARSAAVTWALNRWATWMVVVVVVVATPAADVQDLLAGRQAGKLQQLLGGAAAAGVDDALAEHGQERIGVQRLDLGG
jgi:hypothetical protein